MFQEATDAFKFLHVTSYVDRIDISTILVIDYMGDDCGVTGKTAAKPVNAF